MRVARAAGVDAIHPGYGFLSENPELRRRLRARGDHVHRARPSGSWSGWATRSRPAAMAERAGVPVLPGTGALPPDPAEARRLAEELGYPVMVKAAGRRRPRHAGGARPRRARRGRRGRAPRGAGGVRQRRRLPGALRRARPAHRGAAPRRPARQPGPPVRARLLGAAAAPEGRRDRPRAATSTRASATRSATRPCASAREARYDNAGTVEFLRRRRHGRVLLHRGQPADPGRAHRHRGGHRHRHRQGADPASPRACRSADPEIGLPAPGGRRDARLRDPVPGHDRGPDEQLHARLRAASAPTARPAAWASGSTPARRLAARHHAVLRLAAGEGDGLGADPRRGHRPHGPRRCRSSASAA